MCKRQAPALRSSIRSVRRFGDVSEPLHSRSQLNAQQLEFVRQPLTDGVLLGIPGGGKTRCILERILHLTDTGAVPAGGCLVLSFSNATCDDLRRRGNALRPGLFNADTVSTLHSLAGSIDEAAQRDSNCSASLQTVVFRSRQTVQRFGVELRTRVPRLAGVRAIFVDEAQDLSQPQYDLVCDLSKALSAPLVLVGDPNQAIYGFQGGEAKFLEDHLKIRQGFRVQLIQNYLSSSELVEVAKAAAPHKSSTPMVAASGAAGQRPELHCGDPDDLASQIIAICCTELAAGRSVAVIGPVKQAKAYHGPARFGLQWMYHRLLAAGVPARINYKEGAEDGDSASASASRSRSEQPADAVSAPCVELRTVHGAKGLEYDTVLLLNFHRGFSGSVPRPSELEAVRSLVYVGLTRARSRLAAFCFAGEHVWVDYPNYADLFDKHGDAAANIRPGDKLQDWKRKGSVAWESLLSSRQWLPEPHLAELEDELAVSAETLPAALAPDVPALLPEQMAAPLREQWALGSLYEEWAVQTFVHAYRNGEPPVLVAIEELLEDLVVAPAEHAPALQQLRRAMKLKVHQLVARASLSALRSQLRDDPGITALLAWLDEHAWRRSSDGSGSDGGANGTDGARIRANVLVSDPSVWLDVTQLRALVSKAREAIAAGRRIPRETMWRLCLFDWQFRAEAGHRWHKDYSEHLAALECHEAHIAATAAALPDGFEFQAKMQMAGQNLKAQPPICVTADAVHFGRREVIEFKFAADPFTSMHGLQAIAYPLMRRLNGGDNSSGSGASAANDSGSGPSITASIADAGSNSSVDSSSGAGIGGNNAADGRSGVSAARDVRSHPLTSLEAYEGFEDMEGEEGQVKGDQRPWNVHVINLRARCATQLKSHALEGAPDKLFQILSSCQERYN